MEYSMKNSYIAGFVFLLTIVLRFTKFAEADFTKQLLVFIGVIAALLCVFFVSYEWYVRRG